MLATPASARTYRRSRLVSEILATIPMTSESQTRGPEQLHFDQICVGDRWLSQGRTLTETDVVNFAGMTGDYNPLHVDHEYACNTPFGRRIAHGLLGLSLVAGLGSHSPLVRTVAFVAVRDWEFLKPAYIGDTVHARTEVVAMRPNGRRTGHVTWKRELLNQDGEVLQSGLFETLVAAREALPHRRRERPSSVPQLAPSAINAE